MPVPKSANARDGGSSGESSPSAPRRAVASTTPAAISAANDSRAIGSSAGLFMAGSSQAAPFLNSASVSSDSRPSFRFRLASASSARAAAARGPCVGRGSPPAASGQPRTDRRCCMAAGRGSAAERSAIRPLTACVISASGCSGRRVRAQRQRQRQVRGPLSAGSATNRVQRRRSDRAVRAGRVRAGVPGGAIGLPLRLGCRRCATLTDRASRIEPAVVGMAPVCSNSRVLGAAAPRDRPGRTPSGSAWRRRPAAGRRRPPPRPSTPTTATPGASSSHDYFLRPEYSSICAVRSSG